MGNCNSCPSKNNCGKQATCTIENNPNNKIKNIIGIMSGKGGVGKSTVTSLIAKKLNKEGYKVGILDADITGPSIPRLMGLQNERALSNDGVNIYPVISKDGIKTMSINYMVGDESQPVVFKGPLISNTIKITIQSRRREIEIRRLVGASNMFIKQPFFFEGIIIGFIGSILPIAACCYGYAYLYDRMGGKVFTNIIKLVRPSEILYTIIFALMIIGVIVGAFGSYRAVRKYLKV